MKLVSACLLGIKCAWDGSGRYRNEKVVELAEAETVIPVCPEQLGGLPTPRVPQEIQGGTGEDVIEGRCRVMNRDGEDVTEFFLRGAHEVLRIAKLLGVDEFIGKQRSPSCGCGRIYSGSFARKVVDGDGVTAALLRKNGVKVTSDEDL